MGIIDPFLSVASGSFEASGKLTPRLHGLVRRSFGTGRRRLNPLLRRLFAWMQHNAADATEFFRLPPNRIVELGARIEL